MAMALDVARAWPSTFRERQRVVADGAAGGGDSGGGGGGADRSGGARDIPGGVHRRAGVISLRTLRRAAESLGCELVYGLVPKEGRSRQWRRRLMRGERRSGLRRGRASCRRPRISGGRRRSRTGGRTSGNGWRDSGGVLETVGEEHTHRAPEDTGAGAEVKFWKVQMRKALKGAMRKVGVRAR